MKTIKGHEDYGVTSCGLVYSYKSKKFIKPFVCNGYLRVKLSVQGEENNYYVHRLVAETYIPNQNNFPQINHKDENKTNNCIGNLEWCTSKYNINYGKHNEKVSQTMKKQVLCLELNEIFDSAIDAQKQLGIHQSNISACCLGKRKTTGKMHWQFV